MMFKSSIVACILTLCSASSAVAVSHKRESVSDVTIFAYGQETNGDPVFFSNGFAYIGRFAPTWGGTSTNITFSTDSTSATTPWTIAANSSSVTFNTTYSMFIVPTSGSFAQVGFTTSNGTLPTNGTTVGFTWFGTSVAFAYNESDYELQFVGAETNESDIYALYWNNGGTLPNGSFPVTLKSTPPTVLAT